MPTEKLDFLPAFIALAAGAVAMGISPVFVREAEIGSFTSAFWRVFLALPFLLLWALWEARRCREKFSIPFTTAAVLAGLCFAGDLIFWHLAILNTTVANATLMSCLAPVWVLIFSRVLTGEEVNKASVIGLIVCLVGVFILIGASYRLAPGRLIGDFYGFVTSLFFGLYFMAMRVARRNLRSGQVIFSSTLVTTAVLFCTAVLSGDAFIPDSAKGIVALLLLGLVSQAGGQGLLAVALGSLSAVFSSLVIFIEAIAAAIFGWLFFAEILGPGELFGAVLILSGIWMASPHFARRGWPKFRKQRG